MSRIRYEPADIGCDPDSQPCLLSRWNGYLGDATTEKEVELLGYYLFNDIYELAQDYNSGDRLVPQAR
jgi:hypothetical protein